MTLTRLPILVVEDDEDDRLLIRRAFGKARLANSLIFVEDGEKALAYLGGAPPYADRAAFPLPTLILLDLKLPRQSGHEVLAWIRGHAELRTVPVIVLTSSAESADVRRAYELGANSYLVKPVAFSDLLTLIETLGLYWFVMSELPPR